MFISINNNQPNILIRAEKNFIGFLYYKGLYVYQTTNGQQFELKILKRNYFFCSFVRQYK